MGQGEPVNTIISGNSDEAVLVDSEADGGLRNYFECVFLLSNGSCLCVIDLFLGLLGFHPNVLGRRRLLIRRRILVMGMGIVRVRHVIDGEILLI